LLWTGFLPTRAEAQAFTSSRLQLPKPIPWTLESAAVTRAAPAQRAQNTGSTRPRRGVARTVFGAIAGGAAGFFAGGYLGAAIEGDRCNCDDPGLKGALIGAPIGAGVGAVLGARYLF
jgi:hypothetical protein